jgi:hypothetical protein
MLYIEPYLLGYNAPQSVESQLAFRANMSPSSSGSKNNPNKKPALKVGWKICWFLAWLIRP